MEGTVASRREDGGELQEDREDEDEKSAVACASVECGGNDA